ncbi:MAG: DUF2155 domain-containing protein [Acetobacteraceae bacterium]
MLLASPAAAQDAWLPKTSAELLLLDKIRAQPSTVEVKVGQRTTFGSLTIEVRSCVVRPADQPADAAAFLDVTDSRPSGAGFHGWLLANTPAVAQLEHPIYDLRLASCR